jgi:hypothetical protein
LCHSRIFREDDGGPKDRETWRGAPEAGDQHGNPEISLHARPLEPAMSHRWFRQAFDFPSIAYILREQMLRCRAVTEQFGSVDRRSFLLYAIFLDWPSRKNAIGSLGTNATDATIERV